jgi:type IV pilus assembly protein PilW
VSRVRYVPRAFAQGLSLIELMVAIVLSSILVLGLVEVFAASRTAYQLSQGMARAQENGRFAVDFLQRDLRMVGHAGCVNDQSLTVVGGGGINQHFNAATFPLRFDVAIQGFEATGTAPGNARTLPATLAAGAATAWSPNLPAELSGIGARGPIAGSDVVVLRFLTPVGTTLQSFVAAATSVATPAAGGASVSTQFTDRSLFGISDCTRASIFQATSVDATSGAVSIAGSGLNTTALGGSENYAGGQAVLYRAESVAYYVGVNAEGNPALYRARWDAAPGAGALTRTVEELVEGVESLQLLFGEDSAAATAFSPNGYVGAMNHAGTIGDIADADQVKRWRRVAAVQVGILARSIQPSANGERPEDSVLGVRLTPPADAHYRTTYETTIALRNRMFGN